MVAHSSLPPLPDCAGGDGHDCGGSHDGGFQDFATLQLSSKCLGFVSACFGSHDGCPTCPPPSDSSVADSSSPRVAAPPFPKCGCDPQVPLALFGNAKEGSLLHQCVACWWITKQPNNLPYPVASVAFDLTPLISPLEHLPQG